MRTHLALAISFTLLGTPRGAFAAPSPSDKAAAQALFDEAYRLMSDGKFAAACPKLEESARLDPAMGTRFRLAECHDALGKSASAWAGYVEVADLARASGQEAREKVARERAERLRPTLARLTIAIEARDIPGLEIRRDGSILGAAQWGTSIPVDPGTVRVTATAPRHAPWATDVVIPRAAESVVVRVPALAEPIASEDHANDAARAQTGSTRRVVGITLAGAGGVALVTGGVLGLIALSNYDSVGDHCRGDVCDAKGKATTDSARDLADVATWVCGAGAVAAAGGAILWLSAPSRSARGHARLRVVPRGIALEGAF